MTTCHTAVDQHRPVPDLLLLGGKDHGYAGRTAPVELTTRSALDATQRSGRNAGSPHVGPTLSGRPVRHVASWNAMAGSRVSRAWQLARVLVVALALISCAAFGGRAAIAHAPALVTATAGVALLTAPSAEAPVLAVLPAGAEVQLTGAADGEFLEVSVADQLGWAGAAGFGSGIDTAPVVLDATLRAEPAADGAILSAVPAGSTVILTGAVVDGFVAASFAGTGGWLPVTAIV